MKLPLLKSLFETRVLAPAEIAEKTRAVVAKRTDVLYKRIIRGVSAAAKEGHQVYALFVDDGFHGGVPEGAKTAVQQRLEQTGVHVARGELSLMIVRWDNLDALTKATAPVPKNQLKPLSF